MQERKAEIEAIRKQLREHFPTLHLSISGKYVFIEGMYYLYNIQETEIDHYQIRIQLLEDYPKSVPIMWEISGRIPRVMDRHVYPERGNCCLFLPDETFDYYKPTDTLINFINGPVRAYFFIADLL